MKTLIAIPSKGRVQQLQKNTLKWATQIKEADLIVFVEPQDFEAYSNELVGINFVVLPENDKGLGYAKKIIGEFAKEQGYEVIIKLDDDIKSFNKRSVKSTPEGSAKNLSEALATAIALFNKYSDLAAVGFPYRFELWGPKRLAAMNARLQTAYIIRTQDWHGDERISTFEDFVQFLRIRLNNRFTLRIGDIGIDCAAVGEGEGGLQVFDREEMAQKEIDIIRSEMYPPLEVRAANNKRWSVEPSLKGAFFATKKL